MKTLLRITTVSHSVDLLLKGQLKFMSNQGLKVFFACTRDEHVETIAKRENAYYIELPLTRTINPFKDLISLIKAIQIINKCRPDIVHTHSPKAGIVGMLAARLCGVPLKIHTVAGLPLTDTRGVKRKLLIYVEKITYACADFVLPNSHNQRLFIHQNIYKSQKVQVIGSGGSNGVDLKYFDRSRYTMSDVLTYKKDLGIKAEDLIFCFVGRLAFYKGVNELVEAFIRLNKTYTNIKLLLVGPLEELNPLLDITLRRIKESNSIISVGHQKDIRPYLLVSDVFVFPSYREGFPQSLLQATAFNLACIATDINGCNEIIEHEVNGLLIQPKSADAIYEACEKILKNPEMRKTLAHNGRISIAKRFDQHVFWSKIFSFYLKSL